MDKRRIGTPTREKIFAYWDERHYELGPCGEDEWGISENECFACGNVWRRLERAHIIPYIVCKNNDISNIHLLCTPCHSESEGNQHYWTWLRWKRKNEWMYPMKHLWKLAKMRGIDIDEEIKSLGEEYSQEICRKYSEELHRRLFC